MMQSGQFHWITHTCSPCYKIYISNAHEERYKLRMTKRKQQKYFGLLSTK